MSMCDFLGVRKGVPLFSPIGATKPSNQLLVGPFDQCRSCTQWNPKKKQSNLKTKTPPNNKQVKHCQW